MITERKLSILQCPVCRNDLSQQEPYLVCVYCSTRFPVIDNIIVFLTKENLASFLSETWGNELQKENASFFRGFAFVSNEDKPEDLEKVFEEATKEGKANHWVMTGTFPEDSSISKEQSMAIDKSTDRLVDLSRAASARRILDWPTGNGFHLSHMIGNVHPEALVAALDVDFRKLAKIKPYYDENGFSDNVVFIVADARRMPFKNGAFQSVTAWGGTVEIANAETGFKETFRVLEDGGWFGVSGDQYKKDSPSTKIAAQLGIDSLVTKDRLEAAMKLIGFRNLEYEVLFEGYDIDLDTSDEERCPLPARGDWFGHIAASGQK